MFQRGLSSPTSVQNFLNKTNDVIQEWIEERLQVICDNTNLDYLPELSRLFLERKLFLFLYQFELRVRSFSNELSSFRS